MMLRGLRRLSLLPRIRMLEDIKESGKGFGGLFSAEAIDQLWHQRGQHLVEGLQQTIEDYQIKFPTNDLQELVRKTIGKPELGSVMSYSSLLFNLQFFMESLRPNDDIDASNRISKQGPEALLQTPKVSTLNEPVNVEFRAWLTELFGSLAEFRSLMMNSAKSIKGDGYTWLVAESNIIGGSSRSTLDISLSPSFSDLAVINTYNFGPVDDLIRSGQITKLNNQKQAKLEAARRKQSELSSAEVGEYPELTSEVPVRDELELGSVEEAEALVSFRDKKLVPLLAIDVSPRNYLLDYGVFGKQQYLENVWDCIDWDVVIARAPPRTKQFVKLD